MLSTFTNDEYLFSIGSNNLLSIHSKYVFSKAEGKKGARYTFDTKANADGSIKTLAVTDANGNKITYTFRY